MAKRLLAPTQYQRLEGSTSPQHIQLLAVFCRIHCLDLRSAYTFGNNGHARSRRQAFARGGEAPFFLHVRKNTPVFVDRVLAFLHPFPARRFRRGPPQAAVSELAKLPDPKVGIPQQRCRLITAAKLEKLVEITDCLAQQLRVSYTACSRVPSVCRQQ